MNAGVLVGVLLGPAALLLMIIATIATYETFDLGRANKTAAPLMIVAAACGLACSIYRLEHFRNGASGLKLQLALLRERRRLRAADLTLEARYTRSAYKEEIAGDLERLRRESRYYRRIHNAFQAIIIVGSLATTTASGIALDSSPLQWVVVATSFSVGLAAGFTGYFKYRERGFYLQQTADAIEQEWAAAQLSIFRYRNLGEDEQLASLVEEVEKLKSEQRKREQSLDQPSGHVRDGAANAQ
ncbi:SLATT domain-containing protein [Micromonospora sp. NBRC 110037]|uniref:SLATT domain-containing protein n=1 Tax=unclassified Micromonospora TaxID=2617518 RepID=UPI001E2D7438|nr:SLATT domain-containing protein [Micromonospora sp. NBRC 110037]